MIKNQKIFVALFAFCTVLLAGQAINAQQQTTAAGREEFTGSVISYNGPRVASAFFNLTINNQTTNEQAVSFLNTLQQDGQSDLLRAIRNQDLGRFSVGNQLGVPINVVRESQVDGRRRIFVVFERWTQFAEVRGGYRSLDYPFGVIELFIDDRTGRGEGTYIAAARIRWDRDGKTNEQRVEIENFATYPAKLTAVTRRGGTRRL